MIENPNAPIDIFKCSDEELLLSKFWIQDSALYYEVKENRNYRAYKYTIENDELKEFSQINGGCVRMICLIAFVFIVYPFTAYIIKEFSLINGIVLVMFYLGVYWKYMENPEAKAKMESVWENYKDRIKARSLELEV